NLDEIDEEGRWENDKDLLDHLIRDVLDLTEVEVDLTEVEVDLTEVEVDLTEVEVDLTEVEVDLTEVEVVSATRILETKADDRNRMMIVALSNRSMRGKVLRVAKNLREKEVWKHVFISADQTKREREKHY
ncbi:hypothetical protein LSAT2_009718, partial [Lamellibrachia satsuma]